MASQIFIGYKLSRPVSAAPSGLVLRREKNQLYLGLWLQKKSVSLTLLKGILREIASQLEASNHSFHTPLLLTDLVFGG